VLRHKEVVHNYFDFAANNSIVKRQAPHHISDN
jgi:hypothetical protein